MNIWSISLGAVVLTALIGPVVANAAVGTEVAGSPGSVTVEVGQCVSGETQSARSATFDVQMVATSLTAKMRIRIEVQRRSEGQTDFRTVTGPGLGVWSETQTGVSVYKDFRQITNLASGSYRAVVTFVWLNGEGHVIRRTSKHSASCVQSLS